MMRMLATFASFLAASNARAIDCKAYAAGFDSFVVPIIARCATYAGRAGDVQKIDHAREVLVSADIVDLTAFEGVAIRWCDLSNASGMVPDPDLVLLHPALKADPVRLAGVLAHEMKHVEQYRRWGKDEFKCRYVEQVVKGNGHGRSNSVEGEAYVFGDHALQTLQAREGSPPKMPAATSR